MALQFLQANLNHCARAQDLFVQSLAQGLINIGIVSEPYMIPNNRSDWIGDIDGFAALVVTHIDDSLSIGQTRKGRGCVAAKIGNMVVIGTYFSPNKTLTEFETFLAEVGSLVRWSRPHDVIVAGDFNAKSAIWGSSAPDVRGEVLVEWMAAHNLVPLNRGTEHTCVRMLGGSIVDITFANPALARRILGWEVMTEVETLSDHRYIRFDVLPSSSTPSISTSAPAEIGPRWALKSLDKESLEVAAMVKSWCSKSNEVDIECEVGWFGESMSHISDAAMSRIRPVQPRRRVYWWSTELSRLRSACVAARRQYTRYRRRHMRPGYVITEERCRYIAYQDAKKALRSEISEAKERAWLELLGTLEQDPWGRPYQLILSKLRPWAPPLTTSMEPTFLESVISTLFPAHALPASYDYRTGRITEEAMAESIPEVTSSELDLAIVKLTRKNTAPGPDGVHGRVWSAALRHGLASRFCELLTECLKAGDFPNKWKVGRLVLLRKGGKPADSPSAYRPIVLLDEAGKLFERIIAGRIQRHLESEGPNLSDMQYGFRKCRSTVDAIAHLRDVCEESVSQGNVVLAVSLDIANAFNSLPWESIMSGLTHHRIPSYLRRIVSSYLSERRVIFPTCNGWDSHAVVRGVPQGSVLGPLLWNIGYDSVLRGELSCGVSLICYADDTLAVATGRDFKEARLRATAGVAQVVSRIRNLGLTVALDKSEAICFHGLRRAPPEGADIIVSGVSIRVGTTLKYLGLVLDPRWAFKAHMSALAPKLTATATALCRIMPNLGGPSGGCRRLYAGIIRAKALYGCPIWADKLGVQNRTMLRRSQRVMAIRVARAYRTVSYEAACAIAGTAPWHLEATALADIYWRRADCRAQDINPPLELVNRWREEGRLKVLRQWSEELENNRAGHRTVAAIRPVLKNWVERPWGSLSFRLVQILTGHGCFGRYLHRIARRETTPVCHHCGYMEDTVLHTVEDCPAWEHERAALTFVMGDDLSLPALVKKAVEAECDDQWNALKAFSEAVLSKKEEAERAREIAPEADTLRRKRPGRRRRQYAQRPP